MTTSEYKEETARIRPLLLTIALRYMGNGDDAEDVVQDVLLRMWQIRDSLSVPADRLATVLVRNRCIDLLRRRRTTDASIGDIPQEEQADDERMEQLMRAIDTLPEMQQTILRLRHINGMEMGEIASLTGATEAAVRKTLSRARQALKREFLNRGN